MAQLSVFLSPSTKDIAFVRRLEADLQAAGARVYRISADQGGSFQTRINEALAVCEYVVLALTADALASTWVVQEIEAGNWLKHQGRIKEILPIQAGPVEYRAIPPLWGVNNIFDASRDYASGRDGLLRALGLPVASTAPLPSGSPLPAGRGVGGEVLPAHLAALGFTGLTSGAIAYILPPVVSVAAGEFLMGSDPKKDSGAYDDEKPQHRVTLPAYQVARFPTTVAEYACFVRAGQKEPSKGYLGVDWKTQLGRLDHPVTCVSWNDAIAYAAWLAKLTGQSWRLPSEAEWETAARWDGRTARIYPWGDTFDVSRANTIEGGKGTTTAIGSYANGASPCGAQEMTGNVWEWTSSLFKPYPYSTGDGRDALTSTGNRVLRGGSWNYNSRLARAAHRHLYDSDFTLVSRGFRLVRADPNSGR